jgi:hypothetical protein
MENSFLIINLEIPMRKSPELVNHAASISMYNLKILAGS